MVAEDRSNRSPHIEKPLFSFKVFIPRQSPNYRRSFEERQR